VVAVGGRPKTGRPPFGVPGTPGSARRQVRVSSAPDANKAVSHARGISVQCKAFGFCLASREGDVKVMFKLRWRLVIRAVGALRCPRARLGRKSPAKRVPGRARAAARHGEAFCAGMRLVRCHRHEICERASIRVIGCPRGMHGSRQPGKLVACDPDIGNRGRMSVGRGRMPRRRRTGAAGGATARADRE
jgi:hypothetical protein